MNIDDGYFMLLIASMIFTAGILLGWALATDSVRKSAAKAFVGYYQCDASTGEVEWRWMSPK